MGATDTVIETSALTKWFGSHRGIEDVSLAVRQGEVFGLLGPNGAGKSTFIRLLLGLIRPTSGSGRVFGLDAWRDRRVIHRRIGVLPSEFAYESDLTGREVIDLFGRLRGVDARERSEALARRLRADLDRPQKQLSRGNHQKIGLIQALCHDPDLLIFDEPTGGLDPLMQDEFQRIVAELRDDGRTVLLSSHNMAEVEEACDRIAMIHEGRLLAVETIDSLLSRSPKHVRVVFAEAVDPSAFEALPGASNVRAQGSVVEFETAGDVDTLVDLLAKHRIVDLVCERPSLEHAFVRLYAEEDAEQAVPAIVERGV